MDTKFNYYIGTHENQKVIFIQFEKDKDFSGAGATQKNIACTQNVISNLKSNIQNKSNYQNDRNKKRRK